MGYEELNIKGPEFVTHDLVFYLEGKRKIYDFFGLKLKLFTKK